MSLNHGNISIYDIADKLVWDFNSIYGVVSAILSYYSIIALHVSDAFEWWMGWLWKGELPLKIKLFMWLVFKDKNFDLGISSEKGLQGAEKMPSMPKQY